MINLLQYLSKPFQHVLNRTSLNCSITRNTRTMTTLRWELSLRWSHLMNKGVKISEANSLSLCNIDFPDKHYCCSSSLLRATSFIRIGVSTWRTSRWSRPTWWQWGWFRVVVAVGSQAQQPSNGGSTWQSVRKSKFHKYYCHFTFTIHSKRGIWTSHWVHQEVVYELFPYLTTNKLKLFPRGQVVTWYGPQACTGALATRHNGQIVPVFWFDASTSMHDATRPNL